MPDHKFENRWSTGTQDCSLWNIVAKLHSCLLISLSSFQFSLPLICTLLSHRQTFVIYVVKNPWKAWIPSCSSFKNGRFPTCSPILPQQPLASYSAPLQGSPNTQEQIFKGWQEASERKGMREGSWKVRIQANFLKAQSRDIISIFCESHNNQQMHIQSFKRWQKTLELLRGISGV